MSKLDTTPLMDAAAPGSSYAATGGQRRTAISAIAADIATMGTGTVMAGFFNIVLAFVMPKLLSLEDYGYWKVFGLYAAYVGFLHFGFADGALLRWAGKTWEELHREIGPALKYLIWQQIAVVIPLSLLLALVLRGPLQFVAIAVAVYAPIYNVTATLQYSLQGGRIFRPVAISTVAAPALFFCFVLLWHAEWRIGFREVISCYGLAWLIVAVCLVFRTGPRLRRLARTSASHFAKNCVLSGWPIVLSNTGLGLIVYADRLAVSWAVTIQEFAQYSLAASAMAVPLTVIQACNRVSFSHLAAVSPEGRSRVYGISSRMLLIAWALLVPYYFLLEIFVRHVLPRYIQSLQYARILLLGVPFLAAIQILQMSYAYLNGQQKAFLGQTAFVLAVSLGVTSVAAFWAESLSTVAAIQVVVLAGWWFLNEHSARSPTHLRWRDAGKFMGLYLLIGGTYWAMSHQTLHLPTAVATYYAIVVCVLALWCRPEIRTALEAVTGRNHTVGEGI